MIAEISAEHKKELDRMDTEYQMKFQQQADHEKILRQNNETLTKYCEEIERERANEKQLRLKLEEDFCKIQRTTRKRCNWGLSSSQS